MNNGGKKLIWWVLLRKFENLRLKGDKNMQSKKWAILSAFVGIIGGAFLMVSPLGLIAAGIGAKGSVLNSILILMLCAYLTIFFEGVKSKLYYKGDDRVSTFVANTFVLAGVIGCFPILMEILTKIPILYELFYWLFSFVFFGQDPFSLIYPSMEFVALLWIVSGIGYAVCLKNFRE